MKLRKLKVNNKMRDYDAYEPPQPINKLKVKILDKEKFFKWFMRTENARWANQKLC